MAFTFSGSRLSTIVLMACALGIAGCDEDDPSGDVDSGVRMDGGFDAGPDEADAGSDAGFDAGSDAGPFDGGIPMSTTFPPRDFVCSPPGDTQPCPTTEPARSDAERTVDVTRDMSGATLTFVIHRFSMPTATALGTAAGLNRDSLDSGPGSASIDADCEEFNQDFTSLRDPSQIGVDNAFQALVPTVEALLDAADCPGMTTDGCLDAGFATAISEGTLLLLVEVTGLDSFLHDDAVEVALYAGVVSGGGAPSLGADGRLTPGQTFDTMSTLLAPTAGDVYEGRLRVAWTGGFDLPNAAGLSLLSRLEDPELRADISESGLALGVISATSSVDSLVERAAEIMPGTEGTIRSVLESVSDIAPSALDPVVCEQISSGTLVEAVPASRRP